MAAKAKSIRQTDYIVCKVRFTTEGVMLDFKPRYKKKGDKHHHDKKAYEALIATRRPASAGAAAGAKAKVTNGKFNRKQHKCLVSKDRPTRFAFYVDTRTTWRFVKKGIDGKTLADKARFSGQTVSPSGKVVEATFNPEKKTKNYGYELWLQADVVGPGETGDNRPSVTIIVDPIVGGTGGIPP
jgi:hypothetical protein